MDLKRHDSSISRGYILEGCNHLSHCAKPDLVENDFIPEVFASRSLAKIRLVTLSIGADESRHVRSVLSDARCKIKHLALENLQDDFGFDQSALSNGHSENSSIRHLASITPKTPIWC